MRKFHRNVWAVSLTSFFMDISSEMVINIICSSSTSWACVPISSALLKAGKHSQRAEGVLRVAFRQTALSKMAGSHRYGLSTLKTLLYFTKAGMVAVRWADRRKRCAHRAATHWLPTQSNPSSGLAFGFIGLQTPAVLWSVC